ncbi:WRKY [Musa troglodytarum]|uniref:WRKY n=1 Tax=Musa troglodytarum TaxID=320322 RepID=A0A9E7LD85_9LILI|nr:WRKY [Musa troglodytarum]
MCKAWDLSFLLRLLAQADEQMKQLEANLGDASAADHCRSLVQQISAALEEAVSMAKLMDSEGPQQPAWPDNAAVDLPRWNSEGMRRENSETVLKEQERREMCKKRIFVRQGYLTVVIFGSQENSAQTDDPVQVSGSQAGGVPEDGYSWKKYGQKEILGTRHRRATTDALAATASDVLQRSKCRDPIGTPASSTLLTEGNTLAWRACKRLSIMKLQRCLKHSIISKTSSCLCPKTSFMEMQDHDLVSSFSFPSTPLSSFEPKNQIFSYANPMENDYSSTFSSPLTSAPTSEWNYLAVSPCQMSSYGGGTADAALKLSHVEFDPISSIDALKFF